MPSDSTSSEDGSLISASSINTNTIAVQAHKAQGIFFSHDFSKNSNNITFFINSTLRPPTHLGITQGDHATAYVAVLESIFSSTNTRSLAAATTRMDELIEKIFKRSLTLLPEKPLSLNIVDYIQELDVSKSTEEFSSMIISAQKPIESIQEAFQLCKKANDFLHSLQKEPRTTFFSENRIYKSPDHDDDNNTNSRRKGYDEKIGAYALRVLDRICEVCNETTTKERASKQNDLISDLKSNNAL